MPTFLTHLQNVCVSFGMGKNAFVFFWGVAGRGYGSHETDAQESSQAVYVCPYLVCNSGVCSLLHAHMVSNKSDVNDF